MIEPIWRGPLVPVALAATAGIVLDRWFGLHMAFTLMVALAATAASLAFARHHRHIAALVALWSAVGALGAAYHHWHREIYDSNDISQFATDQPQPALVRGVVDSEPMLIKRGGQDELRSFPAKDGGRFVLAVTSVKQQSDWQPASGRIQVHTAKAIDDVHVGDEVEIAGRLQEPSGPQNPGEFDYAAMLRDQRIRAIMSVKDSPDSVVTLHEGRNLSLDKNLAQLRGWGQTVLTDYLPPERQGVAVALLLGDGAPMTQDDWEKYIRTGVIHVLAISGQHLVVLAAFLGIGLRFLRLRLRYAALLTALLLLGYALLVGGRPPVMRSAVAVCSLALGLLTRRPSLAANTFALAWLVVLLLNPTDVCTTGCQLSFLSVAVLTWGTRGWTPAEVDPLARLVAESRSVWLQMALWLCRHVLLSYAITLAIWVVLSPLIAGRQNMLSLAGLVIGPPTVLLTTIALLAGFALLLLAPICPPLACIPAVITDFSLAGCDELVSWAGSVPGACWYVPQVPEWWLWVFYLGVLGLMLLQTLRRLWPWCVLALLVLLTFGLASGAARPPGAEFRCTFLAVGHGGCAVLETPEGQTILYDVGSLAGPELVRRHVGPYLWQRGVRRIDEVMLSHADLDHFNGLVALMERFTVGQISCTPTFQQRQTPAAQLVVKEFERRRVPVRMLTAGTRLRAGQVEIDVLHPPTLGPAGNENSRSLVLLVRHAGHTVLLTGDLEGVGLDMVTRQPAPRIDILMAPHHGNRDATAAMIKWAQPAVVVSCQGPPRGFLKKDALNPAAPPFLGSWPHGAVTIRSQADSLTVETYVSKLRWQLDKRKG